MNIYLVNGVFRCPGCADQFATKQLYAEHWATTHSTPIQSQSSDKTSTKSEPVDCVIPSTSHSGNATVSSNSDETLASDFLRIRSGFLDPVDLVLGDDKRKSVILTVNTREIDVYNVKNEDIEYLNGVMEVAYYSDNNKKVTDVNVRNSKYTKTFDLNLNVEAIMKKMGLTNMFLKPYKLNLYTKGSFFAAHRDTNRPGLAGTLILILPTSYTGGEISFSGQNLESTLPKNKLRFIYFDIGLKHSINTVSSGNRITLVYNVFDINSSKSLLEPKVTLTCIQPEIYTKLFEEAVKFCVDKRNILFGECKYRNDIFFRLLKDLEEKFDIVDVVVEKNDHSFDPKTNDISKVSVVYKVDEDAEHRDWDWGSEQDLEDMAEETYEVEHVLFPLVSTLKEHSVQGYRDSSSRYTGNSPEQSEYEIECYSAYLINPCVSPPEKKKKYY